jgi:hypothetical protein
MPPEDLEGAEALRRSSPPVAALRSSPPVAALRSSCIARCAPSGLPHTASRAVPLSVLSKALGPCCAATALLLLLAVSGLALPLPVP